MPPLTLTILASALQLQGADATITSDNKGIDDLLAPLRYQLQQNVDPNSPRIAAASHNKGVYSKWYTKRYGKFDFTAKPGSGAGVRPGGGFEAKPQGGKRR
jgi:hypothetical protein